MSLFDFVTPLLILVVSVLPLIPVFKKKVSPQSAKFRVYLQISVFAFVFMAVLYSQFSTVFAAEEVAATTADSGLATGLGYIAAALTTCFSSLGAAYAVGSAAPAAIGAVSEDADNFGKAMIFVALAEGVAIYGLLISILILNKL